MNLIELLDVLDDNCAVDVYNEDDEQLLDEYDGKNSIDEKYNSWIVTEVVGCQRRFEVYVKED